MSHLKTKRRKMTHPSKITAQYTKISTKWKCIFRIMYENMYEKSFTSSQYSHLNLKWLLGKFQGAENWPGSQDEKLTPKRFQSCSRWKMTKKLYKWGIILFKFVIVFINSVQFAYLLHKFSPRSSLLFYYQFI